MERWFIKNKSDPGIEYKKLGINNVIYKILLNREIDTKTVQVGNTVKILDIEFDEELEYTIVGSTEVDLSKNRISNVSPIGAALIGAKKGETVEANTPGGIAKYKVLAIKK